MQFVVRPAPLRGSVAIPGSKSHTIRGVLLGALADGTSVLTRPLTSSDTEAAVAVYSALGARFERSPERWVIHGLAGQPRLPTAALDTANSGTTMNVALGTCALLGGADITLTGDAHTQKRSSAPLLGALNDLGAQISSVRANGCPPFLVRGTLRGGRTRIECKISQYLTSLLLACPLATGDSEIDVPLLWERPYVSMTLDWLQRLGIVVDYDAALSHFRIPGRQRYHAFERAIPADFSTATFFLVAGALGDNAVTCHGLDLSDTQGDKQVIEFLRRMGAQISVAPDGAITVRPGALRGITMDLNDCPDALPMLAVLGCFAQGETRLTNVAQAVSKETNRIKVMAQELRTLGADIQEQPDGLVIRGSTLHAGRVNGHGDHRVVMSLAIAGTRLAGATTISTAESAGVTVPQFGALIRHLGGDLTEQPD